MQCQRLKLLLKVSSTTIGPLQPHAVCPTAAACQALLLLQWSRTSQKSILCHASQCDQNSTVHSIVDSATDLSATAELFIQRDPLFHL